MKAETLEAYLRQIMGRPTETALLNGMIALDAVPKDVQETVLKRLLTQSQSGQMDKTESWTFTQFLKRWISTNIREQRRISPELQARSKALWWLRHSARDFLENELLHELLSMPLQTRRLSLQAFTEGIPDQPEVERPLLTQVAQTLERQLEPFDELEQRSQAGTAQAVDAWVELLVRRNLLQLGRPGHHLPTIPFHIPENAEALALKLLDEDFAEYPQLTTRAIREAALSTLAQDELTTQTHLRVLRDIVEPNLAPFAGHGQAFGVTHLLHAAMELHQAGKLPPLTLAALRRSVVTPYRSDHLLSWLSVLTPELNPGEAWSDAVLARLDALPPERREPWPALVEFARTATTGKPTAKWLRDAEAHVKAVGAAPFREVLTDALPLLSRPRTFRLNPGQYGGDPNLLLDEFNALSLKGLLWMVPLVADDALTRAVAGVAEAALRKVPGVGPRAPKIANAAVSALSGTESGVALSALARLRTTVTFKGTLNEVSKALDVVAARLNVTPDELLELGTPTLGLTAVGERVEELGDVQVRLSVDARGAHMSFSRAGNVLKSVPAAVKKNFAENLKELKAAQKEAEQVTAALAQRLDALMIQPRTWVGAAWLERYLNHPVAGTVARRLLWLVDGVPALWGEGDLRDVQGAVVPVSPTSGVALWHPIGRDVAEVLAWRARLEALDVRQPFKQAWREVYVLTDAERRTGTYSNRFAGHVLRQHQFHALAALRGWRNRLRLMVDDSYPPTMRDLPAYGLRAEYWIEGVGENYGEDSTDSGAYLRLTTDQVRFYPLAAPENHAHAGGGGYTMWVNQAQQPLNPLPLEDIPPLVLSEVMRDVDLFVGVASVGNDPTWQDGGPGGRFREYWQSYSFGELNETARTRAAYLERLIPRLKIRDRLSLDGRFLRVQGDRRAYRIHLGSSNILIEPDNQYLCIIPGGRSSGPDVDFDGDRVLSLVLSKAFLLADDTAITDPVILNQLAR
ncbi:DUF4132 domain-containing protein [Deinococcus soli (ex Cha et al. 2016)]|uniref:Uncharacterized protein n=2 Tax=Deinococcus soli (ex Cha et al. 2016) TaxID=1309411 RepID=A0ACC6KJT1_9DEIO|nr:DUF4132 domain-containing protein [Deinococcus soli (ex Cha et al. 2016)]MDR6219804.1 hypothetical protein [Deinococcus soli (ex Cha et al. 2016)]MDR6329938.1 hypothetical protein [Deinococcus soli (ex Cha et al. 2016)]MDR6752711.1 hypothetical protein [Deinococcus soli (ex Cha et al. 2016)]